MKSVNERGNLNDRLIYREMREEEAIWIWWISISFRRRKMCISKLLERVIATIDIYISLYCPFLVSFSLFSIPLAPRPVLKTKLSFTFVQNLLSCFAIRPSRSLHADAALQRYPNLISRSWNSSRRTVASSSKMKKGNRKKKRNDRRVSQRHCYRRYISLTFLYSGSKGNIPGSRHFTMTSHELS